MFHVENIYRKTNEASECFYTELETGVSNCMLLLLCYTNRQGEEESNKEKT
jgi:hypothetical protein